VSQAPTEFHFLEFEVVLIELGADGAQQVED
jgi:hypothetical protein